MFVLLFATARALYPSRARLSCAYLLLASAFPWVALAEPLDSGVARKQVESRSYLSYATESIDNLIAFGTDRYGTVQSPLLVSNLDVTTKSNPTAANFAAADEAWRAERRQRRAPGGSNFLHNQAMYRAMKSASAATGDSSYSNFVNNNFDWALTNLVDDDGLFWWGYHRHYDVHTDEFIGDNDYHEMHFVDRPLWNDMWNRNPVAVRNEIQEIWEQHVVSKTTGQINRHNAPGGLNFTMSSGSFIDAFTFLSSKSAGSDEQLWLNRAKLLANYNWNRRDKTTNLLAQTPNETERWDGFRSGATTPAIYAPALIEAWHTTGDPLFRDQALTYLKSWADYAYDPASGSFWASLELDGTPVPGPWILNGDYPQYEPRGLIDLWAPEFITAQHYPDAAKTYALAYAEFGDPELLDTANKWAALVRRSLPAKETQEGTWYQRYTDDWAIHGTYAEHYGHLIEFFISLHGSTGEAHYLMSARDLAKDAVSSLWYEGLFRGHPNKQYYEAIDGVGVLVDALIELDSLSSQFTKFGDFNGDDLVDYSDYQTLIQHWNQQVLPYQDGDVNGDGVVNLIDFNRFKLDYFEGPASALEYQSQVPEPPARAIAILSIVLVTGIALGRSSLSPWPKAR